MIDVGKLRKTVSLLIERIEDFLAFSEDLKNLPPGSYPEDEYLRLLVPLNDPIDRLHEEFEICSRETASTSTLLLGEEDDCSRGIALLKSTLEQYWPTPFVAGERGGIIFSRFSKELLVGRFAAMRPRLIRVGKLLSDEKPKKTAPPDDSIRTIAGDIVLRNELTEEDRPSSEWAVICGFSDDTFRNRMTHKAKGATWRIVESGSQRYRVHVEDLPPKIRGSKKQRDEFLKSLKD